MSPSQAARNKKYAVTILKHFFAIFGCCVTILPLFWMVSTSLKTSDVLTSIPPQWIPHPLTLDHYKDALTQIPFIRFTANTIYVSFVKMIGEIFVSAFVAYGFSRFNFKGKKIIFGVLLATLMIPGEITLIPTYIMYSKLGLIDTYFPIAYASFLGGSATFIFFFRMYFSTIPKELDESALMDGASSFLIFRKIILPISVPALVTIGIMSFMGGWNDLLGPLMYLNTYDKYTIQLGLAQYDSMANIDWGAYMAASTMAIIPPVIVFFLGQRHLVDGIKMGGIKG